MSKKTSVKSTNTPAFPGYTFIRSAGNVQEFQLKSNGLRVLYVHRPDTGVVTTNITYLVGARDEQRGETGLAHMLEHMLFKPTTFDVTAGITAGSGMQFERDTGCILNANTWKDRTTYYFSYPKQYLAQALQIEAERMEGVILEKKVLTPEQGNVLSEFDMYNGDPYFALSVEMCGAAFQSHPYGHETIGYRSDIEDYTAEKLEQFYRNYYRPDNAVMMVIGDIELKPALTAVKQAFGAITQPVTAIPRMHIRESKQEGLRRFTIERPSTTNIISLGFKHAGFPSKEWFIVNMLFDTLTTGPESVLQRLLVDSGKASSVDHSHEPTSEENIATINITLAPGQSHEEIEHLTLAAIKALDATVLTSLVKKSKAQAITDERFAREHSLSIAQELTEYVSSGSWETYAETLTLIQTITAKDILATIKTSFTEKNMTIGYFKGIQ